MNTRRLASVTSFSILAALSGCGVSRPPGEATDQVGSASQPVLGNELEGASCHAQDVPNISRAFQWARIAVNSPAFAECVDKAFSSFVSVTPPGYGLMQIGPYNPCLVTADGHPDPATPGPGTILSNALSPNPVDIECDYNLLNTSEGGFANVGSVPLSDTSSRETITLGSVLGGFQGASAPCYANPGTGACITDDAYAQVAEAIMHEIMHQKGYDHTGYNPGNACTMMTPDQLCGIPCSENPYYGSSVPYEVGECVRVVLEESMVHCGSMHDCPGGGLQLVDSIFSPSPWCGCVTDPAVSPSCSWSVQCSGATADVYFSCPPVNDTLAFSRQNADGSWTLLSTLPPGSQPASFFDARPIGQGFVYQVCDLGGCSTFSIGTICDTNSCVPTTCAAQGATCGSVPDGCYGTLQCGECGPGQVCSGNQCVACQPTTCAAQGATCGSLGDGCGGTLQCGECAPGLVCSHSQCVDCVQTTCAAQGATCGSIWNACGGPLQCGTCSSGNICVDNQCVEPPPKVVNPPQHCRGLCQ
jgi:hypothetical protein